MWTNEDVAFYKEENGPFSVQNPKSHVCLQKTYWLNQNVCFGAQQQKNEILDSLLILPVYTIMTDSYLGSHNSFWVWMMDVVRTACLCGCCACIWSLINLIFIIHFAGQTCEWTLVSNAFDVNCLLHTAMVTN